MYKKNIINKIMIYLPELIWHLIKEYILGEIINIKSWYYIIYFRKIVIKYIMIKNIPNLLTSKKKYKEIKIREEYKNIYHQNYIIWRYLRNKDGYKCMKKMKIKSISIK